MSLRIEPSEPLTDEDREIMKVIEKLKTAKKAHYSDILISFDKGVMSKCDLTLKERGASLYGATRLKE